MLLQPLVMSPCNKGIWRFDMPGYTATARCFTAVVDAHLSGWNCRASLRHALLISSLLEPLLTPSASYGSLLM